MKPAVGSIIQYRSFGVLNPQKYYVVQTDNSGMSLIPIERVPHDSNWTVVNSKDSATSDRT